MEAGPAPQHDLDLVELPAPADCGTPMSRQQTFEQMAEWLDADSQWKYQAAIEFFENLGRQQGSLNYPQSAPHDDHEDAHASLEECETPVKQSLKDLPNVNTANAGFIYAQVQDQLVSAASGETTSEGSLGAVSALPGAPAKRARV